MNCDIYLRKGTAYLPTMGKMDRGFYRGVEPVAVVSVSSTDALRQALATTIARGNPNVPTLRRSEWEPPVILKYAGVKSWPAFEQSMLFWIVQEKDGIFQIVGQIKQDDGMWRDDPGQTVIFPPRSTTDMVINRMIAILQDAAGRSD